MQIPLRIGLKAALYSCLDAAHSARKHAAQLIDLIESFPGKAVSGSAEVTIGRSLLIDRPQQVQVLKEHCRELEGKVANGLVSMSTGPLLSTG